MNYRVHDPQFRIKQTLLEAQRVRATSIVYEKLLKSAFEMAIQRLLNGPRFALPDKVFGLHLKSVEAWTRSSESLEDICTTQALIPAAQRKRKSSRNIHNHTRSTNDNRRTLSTFIFAFKLSCSLPRLYWRRRRRSHRLELCTDLSGRSMRKE